MSKWYSQIGSKIAAWYRWLVKLLDRKIVMPVMVGIVRFLSNRINLRIEEQDTLCDWKKTALKDFKFWLEDIPDSMPQEHGKTEIDGCDLYTLLSEFSGLRQEIKMQNREQNKALQTLSAFIGTYHETADLFKEKTEQIAALEERIRLSAEKKASIPFLEIRDALVRGHKASIEVAKSKGFFGPKGIEGITEGYELAIRRFDRALEYVNIRALGTIDLPFNPKFMKAVEKRRVSGKESGIVIEEQVSGFIRGEEVIRFAEVVVSE